MNRVKIYETYKPYTLQCIWIHNLLQSPEIVSILLPSDWLSECCNVPFSRLIDLFNTISVFVGYLMPKKSRRRTVVVLYNLYVFVISPGDTMAHSAQAVDCISAEG